MQKKKISNGTLAAIIVLAITNTVGFANTAHAAVATSPSQPAAPEKCGKKYKFIARYRDFIDYLQGSPTKGKVNRNIAEVHVYHHKTERKLCIVNYKLKDIGKKTDNILSVRINIMRPKLKELWQYKWSKTNHDAGYYKYYAGPVYLNYGKAGKLKDYDLGYITAGYGQYWKDLYFTYTESSLKIYTKKPL
jgi:hypothetical protein